MSDFKQFASEAVSFASDPAGWVKDSLLGFGSSGDVNPWDHPLIGKGLRKLLRRGIRKANRELAQVPLGPRAVRPAILPRTVVPVLVPGDTQAPGSVVRRALDLGTSRTPIVAAKARPVVQPGSRVIDRELIRTERGKPQPAVVKTTPVTQQPSPGASKPSASGQAGGTMAVRITPTSTKPGGPMDLGDALLQLGTSYISSKYGASPQVQPAGLPIPGTTWELEGDIPFIDLAKRPTTRRRRRKLLTTSDMNVLNMVQASLQALSPGQAKLMMPLYLKAMNRR